MRSESSAQFLRVSFKGVNTRRKTNSHAGSAKLSNTELKTTRMIKQKLK